MTLPGISAVVRSDGPVPVAVGVAIFGAAGSTLVAVTGDAACCGMGGRAGRLNAVAFVLVVIEAADLLVEESAAVDTGAKMGFSVTVSFGARIVPCVAARAAFSFESVAESPARVPDADAAEPTATDDEGLALVAGFSTLSRSSSSSAWADATSAVSVPVASSS
jgi:hypothetical protein